MVYDVVTPFTLVRSAGSDVILLQQDDAITVNAKITYKIDKLTAYINIRSQLLEWFTMLDVAFYCIHVLILNTPFR